MVVAGDEFGRTQNGNNNPWALDSIAMRNNYETLPRLNLIFPTGIYQFIRFLIKTRPVFETLFFHTLRNQLIVTEPWPLGAVGLHLNRLR